MKQSQIVKILAIEFATAEVTELNKLLRKKDSPKTKYRLSGTNLGHLGVTGIVKMLTPEGVKITGETRTILVRYADIDEMNKAKDRSERPVYSSVKNEKPPQSALEKALEDDDEDDGDYSDLMPVEKPKRRRRPTAAKGKSGSKFIPKDKK